MTILHLKRRCRLSENKHQTSNVSRKKMHMFSLMMKPHHSNFLNAKQLNIPWCPRTVGKRRKKAAVPLQQVGIACKAQIVREIAQSRSKRVRTFQPTHPPTGKHVLPVLPLLKSFFVCQFMSIPLKGATSWGNKNSCLEGNMAMFHGNTGPLGPYLAPPWHGHQSAGAKIARSPQRETGIRDTQHRSHLGRLDDSHNQLPEPTFLNCISPPKKGDMSIENKYYSKIVIHHLVLDPLLVIPIPNCHRNPSAVPPTSSRTSIGTSFCTFSGKPSTRRLFTGISLFKTVFGIPKK